MTQHPQFAEDLDLLAFGLLDPSDCASLRAHLEDCPACRERFEQAQGIAALLSLSTPAAAPPARVRQALLERIAAERRQSGAATVPPAAVAPARPQSQPRGFWSWPSLGWAVAAAMLLLAIGLRFQQDRSEQAGVAALRQQLAAKQDELDRTRAVLDLLRSTDSLRVHLVSSTAPWPWPEGKVYYQPKNGLLFLASHLPPLDPGKAYQLWVVPEEGSPASAGIFEPDSSGNATLLVHKAPPHLQPRTFAVTIEDEGGAQGPTGPQIMVGQQ